MLKPVCGLVWSWGWVREWVSGGQQGHQGYRLCVYSVCVCINLCFLILLFRQMYSAKSITALEAMIFLWFSSSECFFYIKFYVSSSLSYCWAIRPPLSFSFFLCPFALQPPVSLPPLQFHFLFCLFCSLSLPSLSLFLSGFAACLFPAYVSLFYFSLWRHSLLMAQELLSLRLCFHLGQVTLS